MDVTLLESPDQKPRREVAELRQQVGYWKGMFEQAKRKNEKLQKEVGSLRAENRQLKDRLFAAKSEKKSPKDRSNGLDDPKADKQPRRPRGHQPDAPGPKRRDYAHLPAVEEEVDLPPDETVCPKCGKPAAEMSETEDSEVIEVDVRAHRRTIRRKRYRRTCNCPDVSQTLTAPAPPKLIPNPTRPSLLCATRPCVKRSMQCNNKLWKNWPSQSCVSLVAKRWRVCWITGQA